VKITRCPTIYGQYMDKREMGPEIKKRRRKRYRWMRSKELGRWQMKRKIGEERKK